MEEEASPFGGPPPAPTEVLFVNQADSPPKGPPHRVLGGGSLGRKSGDQGSHPSPNTNQLRNSQAHSESWAAEPLFPSPENGGSGPVLPLWRVWQVLLGVIKCSIPAPVHHQSPPSLILRDQPETRQLQV